MPKPSLDHFFGQASFTKSFELGFFFTKEIFTPQDLGVSYTNINYWDKQGILSSRRAGKTAWRNFSFIDYVWLRVIDEFRQLGIPTSLIKEAKNACFQPLKLDYKKIARDLKNKIATGENSFPFLDEHKEEYLKDLEEKSKSYSLSQAKKDGITTLMLAINISIKERTPVSLLLFKDGDCDFWIESRKDLYAKEFIERKIFESHVSISLSAIIKDFLLDSHFTFLSSQLPLLQQNETRLMELIHSGSYDSIMIHFKDKKMKSLELKKTQDTKRKIVDILTDGAYQDIILRYHKGMVTRIQNTLKVYLDEK